MPSVSDAYLDAIRVMFPSLVRRCPECGHVGLSRRFATVNGDGGRGRVECPRCGHQFPTLDGPVRN